MYTDSTKVIIRVAKMLYPNVFKSKSFRGEDPKYSARILIPKLDDITVKKIKTAIQEAYKNNESALKGNEQNVPPIEKLKLPLHDGDKEKPGDKNYSNTYFINANSRNAPEIIDKNKNPITDENEIYSGVICAVSLRFFAYNVNGNKGIGCSLGNIMKVKDGERISTRISAADDFANLDDDDFDFSF